MAAGEPERKEQADAIGATEIEILADHRFEEVAALHRPVEDLGQADFELPEREPMVVAGGAIGRGQRPGQPRAPSDRRTLARRPARAHRRCACRRVGSAQARKPLSRLSKRECGAPELLLDPLVAVETELDGIRQVGARS